MTTLKDRFQQFSPIFATTPRNAPIATSQTQRHETIYQMILREILSPFVEDRGFMVCGQPGTGKTMIATNLIARVIRELPQNPLTNSIPVLILTFNPDTFYNEFKHYKMIDAMNYVDDTKLFDIDTFINRIQIIGYKSLESRIFKGGSLKKKDTFHNRFSSFNADLENLLKKGQLEIKDPEYLTNLEGALIIADEAQVMYANGYMNMRGCALDYIMKHTKYTKLCLITATPVANSALEIVPVLNLLLQADYVISDFFDTTAGTFNIKPNLLRILDTMGSRISMINSPQSDLYPNYVIEGTRLPYDKLPFLNFVYCPPTDLQYKTAQKESYNGVSLSLLEYSALYSHLTNPPTLLGIDFNNRTIELSYLKKALPSINQIIAGSARLKWIYEFLNPSHTGALLEPGNTLIFTPMVMYPGAILIEHLLQLMGLVSFLTKDSSTLPSHAICLDCGRSLESHKTPYASANPLPEGGNAKKVPVEKDHTFRPTYYAYLNRKGLNKSDWDIIFRAIQNPKNLDGSLIKVCIGSKAVNVGLGFPFFNKLIIYSAPSSIAMFVQLIGRLVRPGIVDQLPINFQLVRIYNLLTVLDKNFAKNIPDLNPDAIQLRSSELELNQFRHEQWIVIVQLLEYLMSVSYLIQILSRLEPTGPQRLLLQESSSIGSTKNTLPPYTAQTMHDYLFPQPRLLKPTHKFNIPSTITKKMPPSAITTLGSRIVILMRAIRQILFIYNIIDISDLIIRIKKLKNYYGYNLSAMTDEEINCAILFLVHLSSIIQVPALSQQLATITFKEALETYENFIQNSILPYLFGVPNRLKRIIMLNNNRLKLIYDDIDESSNINELVTALTPLLPFKLDSIPLTPCTRTSTLTYTVVLKRANRFVNSATWPYSIIDNNTSTYLFWAITQAMIHKPHIIRQGEYIKLWNLFAALGWLWEIRDFQRYEVTTPFENEINSDQDPLLVEAGTAESLYPMGLLTESYLYIFKNVGLEPEAWPLSDLPSLATFVISPLYCQVQHYKTDLIVTISSNISERERTINSDRRKFRRMISIRHLNAKSLLERLHNLNEIDRNIILSAIEKANTQTEIVLAIKKVFVKLQIEAHSSRKMTRYFITTNDILHQR